MDLSGEDETPEGSMCTGAKLQIRLSLTTTEDSHNEKCSSDVPRRLLRRSGDDTVVDADFALTPYGVRRLVVLVVLVEVVLFVK